MNLTVQNTSTEQQKIADEVKSILMGDYNGYIVNNMWSVVKITLDVLKNNQVVSVEKYCYKKFSTKQKQATLLLFFRIFMTLG